METAAGVIIVLALFLAPSIVLWLKGKKLWATLGFWTMWHWIPAIRVAKPNSWWARRFYGEEKLAEANARFATEQTNMPSRVVERVEDFDATEIVYQDKITRRAWAKAQRQAR